jgi:hypothetical protein
MSDQITPQPENQEEVVDIDVKGAKVKLTFTGGLILGVILIIIIGGAVLLTSQFNLLGCQHESVKVKIQKKV